MKLPYSLFILDQPHHQELRRSNRFPLTYVSPRHCILFLLRQIPQNEPEDPIFAALFLTYCWVHRDDWIVPRARAIINRGRKIKRSTPYMKWLQYAKLGPRRLIDNILSLGAFTAICISHLSAGTRGEQGRSGTQWFTETYVQRRDTRMRIAASRFHYSRWGTGRGCDGVMTPT